MEDYETMKILIKKIIKRAQNKKRTTAYLSLYKKYIACNPELGCYADGEEEWLSRWGKYLRKLSPLSYRIFSRYIGPDMDIVPLEVCVNVVEPVLTPAWFSSFYNDKNSLDCLFPESYTPKVYIRNINGIFYDGEYHTIHSQIEDKIEELISSTIIDSVVLKPTLKSSGRGVKVFKRQGKNFCDKNGELLSLSLLNKNYKCNYLICDYLEQSEVTAFFNKSSVNTIRVATYRDRKGVIHPLRAILRIGSSGSDVDNAHAGGVFCGIDSSGRLGSYVCDWLGNRYTLFNNVDFSRMDKCIPQFDKIQDFAVEVSGYVLHHDLIALDIVLDKFNEPRLLEINVRGFGGWAFQFTSGSMFGKYTEEILEYCFSQQENMSIGLIEKA